MKNLHKLDDLIHGYIETGIDDMKKAFDLFKVTKGVRVFKIDEELESKKRVVLYFVFNESICGKMELRIHE